MTDNPLELDDSTLDFGNWAPTIGKWDLSEETARYIGPEDPTVATGLALSPYTLVSGLVYTTVRFSSNSSEKLPQGRIVFGHDPETGAFFSAGLGGYNSLYVVEEFDPGQGLRPIRAVGDPTNLGRDTSYELVVGIGGHTAALWVNGVEVLDVPLPRALRGSQVGITAWGVADTEFSEFRIEGEAPNAFVVMKFEEPYDTLYREVIAPTCIDAGYQPIRADEFAGPGLIIEDIIQGIRDADVVIAEITPVNANVFYELGYAHASSKPTILLAEHGHQLPFDVSGFRCIFYEDTIGGKPKIESELRRHLDHIS